MQTLMRGTPIYLKTSTGYDIWQLDTSAGVETEPIAVSETTVHSLFYKIGNAAHNLTITVAKGFRKGDTIYWTAFEALQPTPISSFTGSTDWQCMAFTLPYCSYIKFNITGTSTSTSVVLMVGAQ